MLQSESTLPEGAQASHLEPQCLGAQETDRQTDLALVSRVREVYPKMRKRSLWGQPCWDPVWLSRTCTGRSPFPSIFSAGPQGKEAGRGSLHGRESHGRRSPSRRGGPGPAGGWPTLSPWGDGEQQQRSGCPRLPATLQGWACCSCRDRSSRGRHSGSSGQRRRGSHGPATKSRAVGSRCSPGRGRARGAPCPPE